MSVLLIYLFAGLGALGVSLLAHPIGRALRIVDYPDGRRKAHRAPTPLTGGLAVNGPFVGASAYLAFGTGDFAVYGTLVIAVVCFLLLGFIDDRERLRPTLRLFLSVMLCVIVVNLAPAMSVAQLHFSFSSGGLAFPSWNLAFTVLVLVGFVYAFNMIDGIDGLAIGVALVWSLLLFGYVAAPLLPLLGVLVVGLLVAFAFNMMGRQFLGDSGTYALSVVVALLTIYSYNLGGRGLEADMVVVWFIVPVVDCLRLMFKRVLAGRSPLSADTDHLHHVLCRFLPPRAALVAYLLLVGVPGALTVLLPSLTAIWFGLCLLAYGSILAFAPRRRLIERRL